MWQERGEAGAGKQVSNASPELVLDLVSPGEPLMGVQQGWARG